MPRLDIDIVDRFDLRVAAQTLRSLAIGPLGIPSYYDRARNIQDIIDRFDEQLAKWDNASARLVRDQRADDRRFAANVERAHQQAMASWISARKEIRHCEICGERIAAHINEDIDAHCQALEKDLYPEDNYYDAIPW